VANEVPPSLMVPRVGRSTRRAGQAACLYGAALGTAGKRVLAIGAVQSALSRSSRAVSRAQRNTRASMGDIAGYII